LDERADARKEKIDADTAWKIISNFETVHIGRGKKVLSLAPSPDTRDDILKAAMGRSGNLRAPTLKTKDAVFIGFNDDMYHRL
jgi:hypothetical protein